jgi:hypothetical protein
MAVMVRQWKGHSSEDVIVGKIQKPDAESMIAAAEELIRVL